MENQSDTTRITSNRRERRPRRNNIEELRITDHSTHSVSSRLEDDTSYRLERNKGRRNNGMNNNSYHDNNNKGSRRNNSNHNNGNGNDASNHSLSNRSMNESGRTTDTLTLIEDTDIEISACEVCCTKIKRFNYRVFFFKTFLAILVCTIVIFIAYFISRTGYPEVQVMIVPKSHEIWMELLYESVSETTQEQIDQTYTAQALAYEWMDKDPKLPSYDHLWRIRQRFAIATLYYSFNGLLWTQEDKGDWLSYEVEECEWFQRPNVCSNSKRLERLILDGIVNFRGELPPDIIDILLPDLKEITIVRMTSQAFWIEDLLPATTTPDYNATILSNLTKIDLSYTRLQGTIPIDTIVEMSNLQEINFAEGGSLTGTIPPEFLSGDFFFNNLQSLNLQGNQLTGSLPPTELESLNSSSSLKYAHFQRNKLTGRIPEDWCSLSNLIVLNLNDNRLEGAIPHCMMITTTTTTATTSTTGAMSSSSSLSSESSNELPSLMNFSYEGNPQLIPP